MYLIKIKKDVEKFNYTIEVIWVNKAKDRHLFGRSFYSSAYQHIPLEKIFKR